MAKTPSTQSMKLGSIAPNFTLPEPATGKNVSLKTVASKQATVVMFICNHCPFVVHIADILSEVAKKYTALGIQFIGINANDVEHFPDDSPEKMKIKAKEWGFCFPYLYDDSQEIAKKYDAACTPDFYIFDGNLACVYRGQFDDSRPGHGVAVTGKSLTDALDSQLSGKPVDTKQKPSLGCNIKWKA